MTIQSTLTRRGIFPGIFHGWFVVAAAFAVMFVGFGSACLAMLAFRLAQRGLSQEQPLSGEQNA